MEAIAQLLNNGAFWGFLGTCVVAFFGYKGALLPIMEERRKKKVLDSDGRVDTKKATSFDELKAVVEILQGELERKDTAHTNELLRAYTRIEALEKDNDRLNSEVDHLKERLRKAHINHEE